MRSTCAGCRPPRPGDRLHSDVDKGDGSIKYILSGEGASSIFIIDENTGDIHATKRLDREEQAYYTLRAQALDRLTNKPVEPESEFVIKIQDINDNEPKFLDGPYTAGVPEMSPVGTSVVQVTATDADDPTYGNSARVVYSILQGQPYFSVEPKTGVIKTALPNMDREAKDQYLLVIQAKDMVGQNGGLSGTTSVTVTLTDVNDNPPRFPRRSYQYNVPESLPVASVVARIKAADADVGPNAEMEYKIVDGDGLGVFKISVDKDTQEGIITIQKKMKSLAQRRQSAPSLIFVKALSRSRSASSWFEQVIKNLHRALLVPQLFFKDEAPLADKFWRESCLSPISPEAWPLVQSFICHNRTFILDGHVQLKTSLQTQERHLFLFTDILVVAKSKSHSHFKLKCQARLCEMWTAFCTEEVCEGSTDPERSFVLGWPTTNCVANFRSAEQKETWLSCLQSRIREEKEKDNPKRIPVTIIAKDVGTCAYSKTLSVTNVDTANDVILMALQQLGINGSEKDYKLWVISGREHAPYPLIGHEYPFGIKMSHIRDAMPHGSKHCACPRQLQESFLTEQLPQELQCQFVLKPSQVAMCQQLNDLSQKSFKRKRSIINWAFWRGPGTHLDNAPLSTTSAAPGKLFGLLLTTICEDDNLPKPLLDMLSLLYQEGPSTKGIFRRSGSAKTFKELKEKLDSGSEVDLACESIFVTASLFKDFLRNVPGSILSSQLCDKWVSVLDQGNNEEKIKSIQRLLEQLPRANVVLLRYIFGVLHGIEMRSEENQMNAFNLAICIAPSLLWPPVSSTPDIESEFIKKISSLVQFLIENCCRIFGDEITSLFGEILMTCNRENSSDVASLHQNDSSYDSLENEANDEADSSSSDWIKTRDQDNRSRESVFTLSDGDSEHTEVDEIQRETKSKQLTLSVGMHLKFSSQENSQNESLCSSALGFSSAATSGALKTLRRHRRSSEPAVALLASSFVHIDDGHEKATRKASCDVVLSHEDEDYLCQLRSLQMERQKLSNQSLIMGINVGKSDNTNQNIERKDLSHCLLPPTPEGLNICSGFSCSSQSSSGTSPSVSSICSLDSAFSQFSDQTLFTLSETSCPFDSTFQLLKKHEDTDAAVAGGDYLVAPSKVPPSPQPTDAVAERGLVEPSSRPAPLKPTDGVDGYLIKPKIQPLPLKVIGRDSLHDQSGSLEKHYSNPKFKETDQSFFAEGY